MQSRTPQVSVPDLYSQPLHQLHHIFDPYAIDQIENPAYNAFTIDYMNVQTIYWKDQKKVGHGKSNRNANNGDVAVHIKRPRPKSEMRIKNGLISIQVSNIFGSSVENFDIDVRVRRNKRGLDLALGMHRDDIVDAEIPLEATEDRDVTVSCQWKFHVDLDSVYKTDDGKEIYKLCTAKVDDTNKFELVTKIFVKVNGERKLAAEKVSEPFQLRTLKSAGKPIGKSPPQDPVGKSCLCMILFLIRQISIFQLTKVPYNHCLLRAFVLEPYNSRYKSN